MEENKEFEFVDLEIECWHCGEINVVPEEVVDELKFVEHFFILNENQSPVSAEEALGYIFKELTLAGYVPGYEEVRQVLILFHEYCQKKTEGAL